MLDETPFVTSLRVGDHTLRTGATLPRSPFVAKFRLAGDALGNGA